MEVSKIKTKQNFENLFGESLRMVSENAKNQELEQIDIICEFPRGFSRDHNGKWGVDPLFHMVQTTPPPPPVTRWNGRQIREYKS